MKGVEELVGGRAARLYTIALYPLISTYRDCSLPEKEIDLLDMYDASWRQTQNDLVATPWIVRKCLMSKGGAYGRRHE